MIDGLIVAAGESSRMPGYKMLLDLAGKTLIERTVDSLLEVCGRIVLVTGWHADQLASLFDRRSEVELVFNPAYREGMFTSVKAGLPHIRSSRFFFLPGDCPLVPKSVLLTLLATDAPIVVPTFAGQPGHPVLLQNAVIRQILDNPALNNLREFIESSKGLEIAVDSEDILIDVDTQADYQKALAKTRNRNPI